MSEETGGISLVLDGPDRARPHADAAARAAARSCCARDGAPRRRRPAPQAALSDARRIFRHFGLKVLSIALATLLWLAGRRRARGRARAARAARVRNIPGSSSCSASRRALVDVRVRGRSGALGAVARRRHRRRARPARRAAGPAAVPPARRTRSRAVRRRGGAGDAVDAVADVRGVRRAGPCRSCPTSTASRRRASWWRASRPIRRPSKCRARVEPCSSVTEATTEPVQRARARHASGDRHGDRSACPTRSCGCDNPRDAHRHRRDSAGAGRAHASRHVPVALRSSAARASARRRIPAAVTVGAARRQRRAVAAVTARRPRRSTRTSPGSAPDATIFRVRFDQPDERRRIVSASSRAQLDVRAPLTWRHGCSAPTASAARRASLRSTRRPCAASARRSSRARSGSGPARDCSSAATRASRARWIERELAHGARRGRDGRRAPAWCRRRPSPTSTQRDGLRRRRRDLGLAQSVRGQRHQGVLGRRREVHRGARARRSRRSSPTRRWHVDRATRRRPVARGRSVDALPRAPARRAARSPGRCPARRSSSTAPTARRRPWRRGCSQSLGFDVTLIGDEPDGRNINLRLRLDASARHGRRGRRRAAPSPAWRSTATATARSSSTSAGASSTATP